MLSLNFYDIENNWLNLVNVTEQELAKIYLYSFYYAATIITTIGYGSIYA